MNGLRDDFPLLGERPDLAYLDNAATTQKPKRVLDALQAYYHRQNANVHRGVHELSVIATDAFEKSREIVADFIHAPRSEDVIWTSGTTEGINLVAATIGSQVVSSDSEIVITTMEHHSNIVPWQMLCDRTGATLKAARVLPSGELDLDHFKSLLSDKTKVVSLVQVSNALGTINPVQELARLAHDVGALVVVDGAQAAPHIAVDVEELDCDFYAFSAHKVFGPTGIGALYARGSLMEDAPPWKGGGEMIEEVRIEGSTYQRMPHRFEAGTPDIAGAIGFAEAIEYLQTLDRSTFESHEQDLLNYATSRLRQVEDLVIIGEAQKKVPVVSFNITGAHSSDVGTLLDNQGVAVRTGHHCAMPLMEELGISGTVRASFAIYNSREDIDKLTVAVEQAREMLVG